MEVVRASKKGIEVKDILLLDAIKEASLKLSRLQVEHFFLFVVSEA